MVSNFSDSEIYKFSFYRKQASLFEMELLEANVDKRIDR